MYVEILTVMMVFIATGFVVSAVGEGSISATPIIRFNPSDCVSHEYAICPDDDWGITKRVVGCNLKWYSWCVI